MKKYSVNYKNQLRNGWPILFFLVGAIAMSAVVGARNGLDDFVLSAQYSFAGFMLVLVPHLALHLRYLNLSRGWTITFARRARRVDFEFERHKAAIEIDDIKVVEIYLPRPVARNTIQWFPWQGYCFAVIRLRSGKQFLITSLQIPMLRWDFEFRDVKIFESIFCWPRVGSSPIRQISE